MREYGRNGLYGQGSGFNDYGTFGAVPWLQQLWDDLTGFNSQQREFEQQEYLLEREQANADPAYQLSRWKAAGVNPWAVGGSSVAGNSPAAPAVSNSGSQGAAAIGSLANILGAAFAGSEQLANANQTNALLELRKQQLQADITKTLEDAGLSHWSALSISTLLPLQTENLQADFWLKMAQYDNVVAEYDNILAEHEKILSDIELNSEMRSELEQRTLKEQEEKRWLQYQNDFFKNYGFDPNSPLDVSYRNSVVTHRKDQAEVIAKGVETYHNSKGKGEQSAISEFAFSIDYARQNGKNASDEYYGRFGSPADLAGKIAALGTRLITNVGQKVVDAFKRNDVDEVRKYYTEALNAAYKNQKEHPGNRANDSVIQALQAVLMLNDDELMKWYEDNKSK